MAGVAIATEAATSEPIPIGRTYRFMSSALEKRMTSRGWTRLGTSKRVLDTPSERQHEPGG